MKAIFLAIFPCSIVFSSYCQTAEENKEVRFGVALNSGFTATIGELSTAPTGILYVNRHQLELGFDVYPFSFNSPRVFGLALNHKFYPNGIGQRFSLYFTTNLTYTNSFIDHHYIVNNYQTTYNYMSLLGGYGFDLKVLKKAYIGTSLNVGIITNNRKSTNTGASYNYKMFDRFQLDGAIRLNIGYRF